MIPLSAASGPSGAPSRRSLLLGSLGVLGTLGAVGCGDTQDAGGAQGSSATGQEASPSSASPAGPQAPAGDGTASGGGPHLPGGGRRVFPDRRLIALYGTPGTPQLGVLGEQDLPAAVDRVTALAESYRPHSPEPVQPAFEIIATGATADAGVAGSYSRPVDRARLEEWVEGAGRAGVYVVLDLQPGFDDFLTQARTFQDLLSEPHVGLALDPEWRLRPGQRHKRDIGQVAASEINATSEWLAGLVAEKDLPEKVFILHQFKPSMIEQRTDVLPRDGLAFVLHADGHGTQADKDRTWEIMRRGLPDHLRMGWKNFVDEDRPMLTPEQTMAVEPRPWFVSYQ